MMSPRLLVAALIALPLAALPAAAQDYGRDPPPYGQDGGGGDTPDAGGGAPGYGGGPTDSAGLGVRVGKLEGRIREMTGQIEELQNANRKLIEQLQKFQTDVDDRLAATGGRAKRSDAGPTPDRAPDHAIASDDTPKPARKGRDEAFDPDAAPKNDPGQPKPLGSAASAQHDDPGGAPMDLAGGRFRKPAGGDDSLAPTLRLPPRPGQTETASAASPTTAGAAVGAGAPATPREAYDAALGLYRDKQYDEAEKSFSAFLQKNPKSRLAADATYYLGESYAQRGRSREAAEQYLKVSTDFSGSNRAPDAMLHLGISLKSLGAKEQACATFAEVARKYPNAPAYVKSGADREAKRAQCG